MTSIFDPRSPTPTIQPRRGEVAMHHGRPTILIDGARCEPMIYALTDVPGGRWSWEELPRHNIALFCARGFRLVQLDIFLEHLWPEESALDLTLARRQIAGVLDVCPAASVFFRFHLRPPSWWLRAHPEEWVRYADTDYAEEQAYGLLRLIEHDNGPVRRTSMASRLWRDTVTEKLRHFLAAMAETPEGNALVGLQVANGVYGEWHNWGFFDNEPDVSAPMNRAFRAWLRDTYGTEAALRQAWHQPDATFATATAPDLAARATDGLLRDPRRERAVIDYYTCMHQVVADNIIHFAETVKASWPRPIITGTFYGYFFSCFGRHAAGGHLQLQRILAADAIDYLSGPQAYEPEATELGDPYRSRSLIDSVRLHGKLWLDEMDCEPKRPLLKDADYARRLQESVADIRRNTAFSLTKGMGLWYYDFNLSGVDLDGYQHNLSGSQGNWDHPVILRQIERLRELCATVGKRPHESAADVLFVYDTDSFYYTASLVGTDPVSPALVDYLPLAAYRSGVVFDTIHLDDLPRLDLARYRVVVFGNTFVMRAEERAWIQRHVACDGRHLVWHYAPGLIDEASGENAVRFMTELTGFRFRELTLQRAPVVEGKTATGAAMRYDLGPSPITPLFAVDVAEAGVVSLARFTEGGEGAVARKDGVGHTSWFVGLPSRATEPLGTLLAQSGAHRYGDGDAFFYGGSGLLLLHTLTGGPREVSLRGGGTVHLDLPEGPATVLLESDSGTVLMQAYEADEPGLRVRYDR